MVLENITGIEILPQELIDKISLLTTLFQAIGGLIILYIIFNLIDMYINRKKGKQILEMSENLKEIKELLKNKK